MALVYTGPFSGASIPVGQRITGWSNNATGAGTTFSRYRDGDPESAFAWFEVSGNLNYELATARRLVCSLRFNGPTSADPTKNNTGTDWTARAALYTIVGPIPLLPGVRRGIDTPPQLVVRVRARCSAGADTHKVRVYAVGREADVRLGWPIVGARVTGFLNFDIASATYPATPGFSAAANLTIPLDPPGEYCSWQRWPHPAVSTIAAQDVDVLCTYLCLAGIGDAVDGTYIAGLEVWEEAPAA